MELSTGQFASVLFFRVNAVLFIGYVIAKLLSTHQPATGTARKPEDEELAELLDGEKEEKIVKTEAQEVAEVKPVPHGAVMVTALTADEKSVRDLTWRVFQLGLILLYAWWAEFTPLHPHEPKMIGLDLFWSSTLLFLLISACTLKKGTSAGASDLLGRDQTEEWKGWMQFMFIGYHYFHTPELYNPIRVFVSCYVWMTGFGNFSFFYIKGDFGFVRFYNMMWRLNFLVIWLCVTQNKPYILYYIVPLHTFYFVMTYAIMRIHPRMNRNSTFIRSKLIVLAIVLYIIWDIPDVFDAFWWFLPTTPMHGAVHGIQHEWHFRTFLDHYSALFGLVFALNFPVTDKWLRLVAKLPGSQQTAARLVTGLGVGIVFAIWWTSILPLPKFNFNGTNPYTFYLPLLAYVWFRNMTKTIRGYQCSLLVFMGKITLETYLMQHHTLMCDDAKSRHVLFAGFPLVNMILVTVIFVFISHRLYRLTIELRAMLIPTSFKGAVVYLGAMLGITAGLSAAGWALQASDAGAVEVSAAVVVLVAVVLVVVNSSQPRKILPPLSAIAAAIILELILTHSCMPLFQPPIVAESGSGSHDVHAQGRALSIQEQNANFPSFLGENPTAYSPQFLWHLDNDVAPHGRALEDPVAPLGPDGKPRKPTKAFVGTDPVLGCFAIGVFVVMVLSKDSFCLFSKMGLAAAGATLDTDATYRDLHATLAPL